MAMAAAVVVSVSCGASKTSPTPAPAPASTAAPVASLRVATGEALPLGATGLPLTFDASASTGAGLTYRMTFGDGAESQKALDTHSLATRGVRTARVTVTDMWGRSDSASADYFVEDLRDGGHSGNWAVRQGDNYLFPYVVLFNQNDAVSGTWFESGPIQSPLAGSFTPDLRFSARTTRTDQPVVTLEGSVKLNTALGACTWGIRCLTMEAKITGGQWNGRTLTFEYRYDY
jgi:hypothetical protein